MSSPKKVYGKGILIAAVILLLAGINLLASLWHQRIDLTGEKRFTLSAPTKKMLKKIEGEIKIDILLKGDFPSAFKRLANSAEETLQEFKEVAGNKITYRFVLPDDELDDVNTTFADTAIAMGIEPINLKVQLKAGEQQQMVYPAALVHYKGKVIPVNLYSGNKIFVSPKELNSAEAQMEFKFADAIDKLSYETKPLVAYSTGNGEPVGYSTYDLVQNVLRKDYNLFTLNINAQPVIPDTFDLLMIVKPTRPFNDIEKLKIDQYLMNGGKLLLFIDKLEAEMDSLQQKNEVIAYDRGLELNDLLFKYGARINSDLLMDLQCDLLPFDVNGNGQYEWLQWNYFPLFQTKSNHPVNKNLGLVAGKFVNSIDTIEAEGIKKTILLSSSPNSRTIATPALISGRENVNAPENEKFKKHDVPVAVLLEGKFQSLYQNRLSQAMKDSIAMGGGLFVPAASKSSKIILVADGDLVLNGVANNQPIPMGMNQFAYGTQKEFPFANRDFLQNSMDYLIDRSGLMEAKGKDYTLRLLDPAKVEEQKLTWQIINIVAPILLVCLFAIIYQWRRKRKYTTA
ncbi:MAG TPA: gliding motility-associated ABC transporter substrate-binding protein GldG [Ferruginibacter sp.]|nr:gliding motility-associated ABC transporter substrate-binding protein GldG [Ferruginibacter sp.]HPH91650.1 gliding motility-associated ABC transporter substrate-binding protein GldG [Ferruginibacter sp.]